jgi:hypothetical protein|tara:strand:+ start:3016 stop:3585 length:570 start_codon:yes stop_codon:yes gene_type:complete
MCVTAIVASAVAGLAAASQQASVAKSSTERAYAAEEKNLDLAYLENNRLQKESHELYDSAVSDRIRASNRELGSLSVLMGEQGASVSSYNALMFDSSYNTGIDVLRTNQSRDNQIASLQANKRAGQMGYLNQTTLAYSQGAAAVAGANANAIGSITNAGSSYGSYTANQKNYKLQLQGLNRDQSDYTQY